MKDLETEQQKENTAESDEVLTTFYGNNGKFFNAKNIKYFIYVNIGILLTAIGIHFFKTPNGFATGGISGLSVVMKNLLPFENVTPAAYMTVINVLLLIVGFIVLGKNCGILTCYCSLMISLETLLFDEWIHLEIGTPLTDQPLLELVYAVLLTGIGSAILFKFKASSGGTDIIALIFKK